MLLGPLRPSFLDIYSLSASSMRCTALSIAIQYRSFQKQICLSQRWDPNNNYNTGSDKTHREKARWELHKMLRAIFRKSCKPPPPPKKQQLYGHLPPSPLSQKLSKTNKTRRTPLEKQRQTHKWRSSMNPNTWTCKGLPTCKNLFTSALCRHWMNYGRPPGMVRERVSEKSELSAWLNNDEEVSSNNT